MRSFKNAGLWAAALGLFSGGCSLFPQYEERMVEREAVPGIPAYAAGKDKICLVSVDGVLMTQPPSDAFGPMEGTIDRVRRDLRLAAMDLSVKGVLLRVNSPGGEVTAAELLRDEVVRFKATGRPIVAYFEGISASGGYYLSAPCSRIVCHPTAVTGSIGVIAMFPDFSGLLGRLGVDVKTIKSGPMKDAGTPFRKMQPEGEKVFQGMIDEMYDRFLEVVHTGRPEQLPMEKLKPVADGRIYTARQAKENGLVDEIAGLDRALEVTAELSGIPRGAPFHAIRYHKESPGLVVQVSRVQGAPGTPSASDPGVHLSLDMPAAAFGRPGFWYLWAPDMK